MAATPSPAQTFLAPLARLAARSPLIEGLVFWEASGWPHDPAEELEAEEIAFYAEGLLDEGFNLDWRIMAAGDAPEKPDHIQLWVSEPGAPPPPAPPGEGWVMLDRGIWPKAPAP
ncbi:hypothetical protein Q9295_08165 [Xinfangfangia sp. CPCC 101601]|uniref:Uncharacterized protein n=1 Tax=Pseudogemmobacter lacusdianii TaxID=3069608 RepID=A0ABU0VXA9_9RHOB|nr:hypothetical protein [Xinfangfangia sp. CPCC 101601]MDQ2066344.1 hypothetical protein [Xinfangfangia sp. CPCC 101601]